MLKLLGIYREVQHSPDRISDDALILEASAARLKEIGVDVRLAKPEDVSRETFIGSTAPHLVFMMCEKEPILNLIASQATEGLRIVNAPESVLDTYRYRMVPLLKSAKISMPMTELYSTSDYSISFSKEIWVKRGDVHNTQKGDVFLAKSKSEIEESFNSFAKRGIKLACLQSHIAGDLIKFYGVGNGWFNWFYHKNQELKHYKYSQAELKNVVQSAAQALKLEIYGGDAIVDKDGKIYLIDMNAWPSFALFRDEASKHIADYLHAEAKAHFAKAVRAIHESPVQK